jgi:hypothetical protein
MNKYHLDPNQKFTPQLQDQLALNLAHESGGSPRALRGVWDSFRRRSDSAIQAAYNQGGDTGTPPTETYYPQGGGPYAETRPVNVQPATGGSAKPMATQNTGIVGNILDKLGLGSGSSGSKYGDIPFGIRLALASQAASALDKGQAADNSGLAAMTLLGQKNADARRKLAMANRLADNLEATNPQMAAALRADPEMVSTYLSNQMQMDTWTKQHGITRGEDVSDAKALAAQKQKEFEDQQAANKAKLDEEIRKNTEESKLNAAKLAEEMKKNSDQHDIDMQKLGIDKAKLGNDPINQQQALLRNYNLTMPPEPPVQGPVQPGQTSVPPVDTGASPDMVARAGARSFIPGTSGIPFTGNVQQDSLSRMFNTPLGPSEAGQIAYQGATHGDMYKAFQDTINNRPKVQQVQNLETAKLPADMMPNDPAAAARGDLSGGVSPIPGSKADIAAKDVKTKADNKAKYDALINSSMGDSLHKAVGLLDAAKAGKTLPVAGMGGLLAVLPETAAKSLHNELNTIRANLGITTLQALRDSSPTGTTGMGQVSDFEEQILQSVITSIDQLEDPVQIRARLVKLQGQVDKVANGTFKTDMGKLNTLLSQAPDAATKKELIQHFDSVYGEGSANKVLSQFGQ